MQGCSAAWTGHGVCSASCRYPPLIARCFRTDADFQAQLPPCRSTLVPIMVLTLHGTMMSTCTKRVAAALEELEVGFLVTY